MNIYNQSTIDRAEKLAKEHGLKFAKVNQIEGPGAQYRITDDLGQYPFSVEWWPLSRRHTAYIAETNERFFDVGPERLVALAVRLGP